jgi:hypothetical protein
VNTYALFAEHNCSVLGPFGRSGFIVPTGIATDDTTKEFFAALVEGSQLAAFYSFENEEFVFPAVHHAFRFALLTVDRSRRSKRADLVFFARHVEALADGERHFSLSPEEFKLINPNTRTCPTFRSARDAELNLQIYRRAGVFVVEGAEAGNPWNLQVRTRLWHMAEDAGEFRTEPELLRDGWSLVGNVFEKSGRRMLPLLEAKMVQQFDHRFGTYDGQSDAQANQGKLPELDDVAHADPWKTVLPRYWVPAEEVDARLRDCWSRSWLLGWRDIGRSTDQRTVVTSLVPRTAVGHKLPLMFPDADPRLVAALYANAGSLALDYAARQKVGGASVGYFIIKQLPLLRPSDYSTLAPWDGQCTVRDWLLLRVLELVFTAWDLEPFAQDVGYAGPPFRWDPARRPLLRAELDAAFFHLYGLSREDTAYVLDTFPIIRRNDEKAHGEFRTQRLVLEAYDAMSEAVRTGMPYQTRLAPPPADPRVAHPDRQTAVPKAPRESAKSKVLPFEVVAARSKGSVPVYRMKAAAGQFSDFQEGGIEAWVRPGHGIEVIKGMCVVQVRGRSMEPTIPDGAYCLFQRGFLAFKSGDVGLFQLHEMEDPDTGDRFTVKRLKSWTEQGDEGPVRVGRLEPDNPAFEPIVVRQGEEGALKPFAKFLKVLKPES